jgi:methylenetetrahydrofolate reductase (NADPH)
VTARPILERLEADRAAGSTTVSFELFPPRDDAAAIGLGRTLDRLTETDPAFFSVTFGAGGSTRERSLTVLRYVLAHTGVRPVAHLTAVGSSVEEASGRVRAFLDAGITDFLALRGDPPASGDAGTGAFGGAAELVALIRRIGDETGDRPTIGVACFPNGHPTHASRWQDVDVLLAKQEAGAAFAVTQVFFRPEDYLEYVERARAAGVRIPVLPGFAPITRVRQLHRIAELSGLEAPQELVAAMATASTPEAGAAIGEDFAVALASAVLRGGAPAAHYFTFNQHGPALQVHRRVLEAIG